MVILAIKLYQICFKVSTDPGEDAAQVVNHFFGEHATAVFRHKDQVDVHSENAMSAMSNIVVIFHRPSIIQA